MSADGKPQWRVALNSLGNNLSEARELAALLEETIGLRVEYGAVVPRSATTTQPRGHSFKDRLRSGTPIPVDDKSINWSLLRCVISTESLKSGEASGNTHPGHVQLEVNSGGRVFFCFFAPSQLDEQQQEGVAVLKFGPNRLLMQAEQFANELTRHLDICAPDCRIVRQAGASSEEWRALVEACQRLGGHVGGGVSAAGAGPTAGLPGPTAAAAATPAGDAGTAAAVSTANGTASGASELAAELTSLPVVLLMEYCPGNTLLECEEAFMGPGPQMGTFEELGRLFLLDAVLGNADRLPCTDLMWRGNPNNVLYGRPGSRYASHIVAIDSCVQRRPPAARLSAEDEGVDRLAQLLLTEPDVALDLLRSSVLASSPSGLAAVAAAPTAAAEAFRRGFRECLGRVERIKGLLEMMHAKMHDWCMEFVADIKALRPELPIPAAVAAAGPGTASAGGAAHTRLVAHYGPLGIRVGPGSGGGASSGSGGGAGGGGAGGGARGRAGQAAWTTGGAAGPGGSTGSPVRAKLSPYLTSASAGASARKSARSCNTSLGGANPVTIGTATSTTTTLTGSIIGGGSAAGAAASPGARSPPPAGYGTGAGRGGSGVGGSRRAGSQGGGGASTAAPRSPEPPAPPHAARHQGISDGGLGEGSVGGAPSTEADPEDICREGADPLGAPGRERGAGEAGGARGGSSSGGGGKGGGKGKGSSPREAAGDGPPLVRSASRISKRSSPAAAGSSGTGGGSGSGGDTAGVAARLRRLGSGALAAALASGTLPDWLARSPYLAAASSPAAGTANAAAASGGSSGASGGGSSGGTTSAVSGRCKSVTSLSGLARGASSASSSAASSSLLRAHSQSQSGSSTGSGGGGGGAVAGPGARLAPTPQSRLATPHGPTPPSPPPITTTAALARVSASGSGSGASASGSGSGSSVAGSGAGSARVSEQGGGGTSSPTHLPRLARASSRSASSWTSGGSSSSASAGAPAAAAAAAALPQPTTTAVTGGRRRRQLSESGAAGSGSGSGSRTPASIPAIKGVSRKAMASVSPQRGAGSGGGGLSVGNSPAHRGPGPGPGPGLAMLRIKSIRDEPDLAASCATAREARDASGGGGGGGPLAPALRHARSFAYMRSPRNAGGLLHSRAGAGAAAAAAAGSPRKSYYCSPATPKFRSPVPLAPLEPLPLPLPLPAQVGDRGQAADGLYGGTADGTCAAAAGHDVPHGILLATGGAVTVGAVDLQPTPASASIAPSALAAKPPLPRGSSMTMRPGPSLSAAAAAPAVSPLQHTYPLHSCSPLGPRLQQAPVPAPAPDVQQAGGQVGCTAAVAAPLSPLGRTGPEQQEAAATGAPGSETAPTATTPPPDEPATPVAAGRTAAGAGAASVALSTPASAMLLPGAPTPGPGPDSTTSHTRATAPSASTSTSNMATSSGARLPYNGAAGSAPPAAARGGGGGATATIRSTGGAAARRGVGSGVRGTGGGAGRAGGYGTARGTPVGGGSAGRVVLRASPNHASPYEQVRSDMSLTAALKSITVEARKDDLLSSRVAHWKELFRSRGEELKSAVGEWQSRHQLERVLTTGFLDGTHPIVDTYELKVRLEHMLRRLQVLQEAAAAQKPSCVLEPPGGLFLGGAVCADSHHILRHLGITHIVNATEELLLPPPSTNFVVLRVALRDVDDEDISTHFEQVSEFIKSCHASGGSVLVHCSEGKSRSVTLVLAYLMRVRGWRLKQAFDLIKSRRAVACPNAGFMTRLLTYERELYGDNSYIPQQLKKAKPEPVTCPVCGAAVGISSASLAVHMKRAHPLLSPTAGAAAAAAAVVTSPRVAAHHRTASPSLSQSAARAAAAAASAAPAPAAPPESPLAPTSDVRQGSVLSPMGAPPPAVAGGAGVADGESNDVADASRVSPPVDAASPTAAAAAGVI